MGPAFQAAERLHPISRSQFGLADLETFWWVATSLSPVQGAKVDGY